MPMSQHPAIVGVKVSMEPPVLYDRSIHIDSNHVWSTAMEITINRLSGSVYVPDMAETAPARVKLPREFMFWDQSEHGLVGGRVEFVDGRYRIVHLEVDAAEGVTHDVLRSIALSQLVVDAVRLAEPALVSSDGDEVRLKD